MLNFPRVSEIRFVKLIIHYVLLLIILTILTNFGKNLVGLSPGYPIEKNMNYVSSTISIIWLLFAIQSGKYQKQGSK
ncbi:MAG TPA: hypothetical protein VK121_05330 [Pseudogracilibacillus sp.]|nr:hypothetical protein [Pseudogracilibacillus sp.]